MIEDDQREKFDENVRDVFDVESRRGKRPRDPEKLRERRRLLNELLMAEKKKRPVAFYRDVATRWDRRGFGALEERLEVLLVLVESV
jgi:hypothetical protein